jgi:hypothetical protein
MNNVIIPIEFELAAIKIAQGEHPNLEFLQEYHVP